MADFKRMLFALPRVRKCDVCARRAFRYIFSDSGTVVCRSCDRFMSHHVGAYSVPRSQATTAILCAQPRMLLWQGRVVDWLGMRCLKHGILVVLWRSLHRVLLQRQIKQHVSWYRSWSEERQREQAELN